MLRSHHILSGEIKIIIIDLVLGFTDHDDVFFVPVIRKISGKAECLKYGYLIP
jgi:hypothetical protein